ncbi:MAG: 30S ribosomal protein S20 [Oligoflexia bacterium]|nr:30S ribosomal protein S20 [Oligoflexia bacterium]
MATHKSAEKRHRQSLKRRDRNRVRRAAVRTAIKETRLAADSGDKTKALELLKSAERILSKSAGRKIIHPRSASRHLSRLAAYVKKTLTAKSKAA